MPHVGGSDYNEVTNLAITFFSGDRRGYQRCTHIRINEDTILEYNETFKVLLTEDSTRLEIESGRETTEIIIQEDGDGNDLKSRNLWRS